MSNGNMTTSQQRKDQRIFEVIGQKIGAFRRQRDLSQTQLAAACGRTENSVNRAEQGFGLTVPMLLDVADALDCNLYDLVPEDT